MLGTSIAYLVIQIPAYRVDTPEYTVAQQAKSENQLGLIGAVLCAILFCLYLWSQQEEGEVSAKDDHVAEKTVDAIRQGEITLRAAMSDLCFETKKPSDGQIGNNEVYDVLLETVPTDQIRKTCKVLAPFFAFYDVNGDKKIDFDEFRMIFKDLHENLDRDNQKRLFDEADVDGSGDINFEEFVACMIAFAKDSKMKVQADEGKGNRRRSMLMPTVAPGSAPNGNDEEAGNDDDDDDEEEEEEDIPEDLADLEPEEQQRRIKLRAVWMMGLGTFMVLAFSDPMVDVLAEIGHRLDISPFYVSFVLAPIASNASELVAAYKYAQKRTQRSITISLSTLLGAGCMNNTFCLGIFLALVYVKRLAWQFTAETISILAVEVAMGIYAASRQVMSLGEAACVLLLYPMSLALVWFLENKMGLD